ncbi:hypothetical protein [Taibaiella koreensis]|uniref:hypothetical protein n=1 Tax=Taibaiella koreensis TaxID=1268548 RepID=UPI000E59BBCB|nr:hypothetical protein [Taibaiella koreensis]
MPATHHKHLLYNPYFLLSLAVLVLNDHLLKGLWHNGLTGKLSDVAGLIVLSLFLAYLFPRLRQYAILPAALFFVFWKLPVSDGFIRVYNQVAPISITRVVDSTDLWALLVLPLAGWLIARLQASHTEEQRVPKPHAAWILLPTVFALMATSPPKSYYYSGKEGITIGKYYKFSMSSGQLLEALRRQGYQVYPDTIAMQGNPWHVRNYYIKDAVLGMKDTIRLISFSLEYGHDSTKTKLYLNSVVPANFDPGDEVAMKRYQEYYKQLLRSEWVRKIGP